MTEQRSNVGSALLVAAAGAGMFLLARASAQTARDRHYDYRGKVVLITGGSRGLGLVLARELARQGATLVLCGRDPESLEEARKELAGTGAEVLAIPCDVRRADEVGNLVRQALQRFGRIDVLINNAGTITVGPQETLTEEDFCEAMDVHFWATYHTCMAVLPGMRERRQGRIVNITSIGGKVAVPHLLSYCAGKFAGYGFSRGLRYEAIKDGVIVTTVVPGLMRTGSPKNADFKGQHRKEYAWFSIGDSLPFLSTSAEHAAHSILEACRRGDVELVLTVPAKVAVVADALMPEVAGTLAGFAGWLLPAPGGAGKARKKGTESESTLSPSFLTAATESAAKRNRQV